MKKYAYIFPDGTYFECTGKNTENHIQTIKTFFRGLKIKDRELYYNLQHTFFFYYNNVNFDDFAIFSLGWIKITSHYTTTVCFAGYDFQYILLNDYLTPNYKLDIVECFHKFPKHILSHLNYDEIMELGRNA